MMDLDSCINDLQEDEGWEGLIYQDTQGVWTIGYGFNVDPHRNGHPMPRCVGDMWLKYLATDIDLDLKNAYPWYATMSVARCNVLVNMAYELGMDGLAKFENMLNCLSNGDYKGAAAECENSLAAKQAPARFQRHANALIQG